MQDEELGVPKEEAQETRARSYQVVIQMLNPPKNITAAVNFAFRQEAVTSGRLAADVMKCFVYVDGWRIVESNEPPTHSYEDGQIVPLGSLYQQRKRSREAMFRPWLCGQ